MGQRKERHAISAEATKPEKPGKYHHRMHKHWSLTYKERVVYDKQTIMHILGVRGVLKLYLPTNSVKSKLHIYSVFKMTNIMKNCNFENKAYDSVF